MTPRDLCSVLAFNSMCVCVYIINIGRWGSGGEGWGYGISKGQEGHGGIYLETI